LSNNTRKRSTATGPLLGTSPSPALASRDPVLPSDSTIPNKLNKSMPMRLVVFSKEMPMNQFVMLKSHIDAYTRKDGVVVRAHDDKRVAAQVVSAPKKLSGKMKELQNARLASAAGLEGREHSVPEYLKPKSTVGGNVISCSIDDAAVEYLGIPKEKLAHLMMSMIADYGGGEKFKVSVSKSMAIKFIGNGGTVIERTLYQSASGGYSAKHKLFKAGKTGAGSAKDVMRCSLGVYRSLGVKHISMFANLEVGGYAWARFGFLPANWPDARKMILANINEMQSGTRRYISKGADGLNREVKVDPMPAEYDAKVRALLQSDDPRTFWAIADMKLGSRSLGKDMLLGSGWDGYMSLDDEVAVSKIESYIKASK